MDTKLQMTTHYDREKIRLLLYEGFSTEELKDLYFYTDQFRELNDLLETDRSKRALVREIISFAERKGILDQLLEVIRSNNPKKYEELSPYFMGTPNHPQDPSENEPGSVTDDSNAGQSRELLSIRGLLGLLLIVIVILFVVYAPGTTGRVPPTRLTNPPPASETPHQVLPISYIIEVIGENTGEPVVGAEVEIAPSVGLGFPSEDTDQKGRAFFNNAASLAGQTVDLTIRANCYQTYDETVVLPNEEFNFPVKLQPQVFDYIIDIIDRNQKIGLSGVEIKILPASVTDTLFGTTDLDGRATIRVGRLYSGKEARLEIRAAGYQQVLDNVKLCEEDLIDRSRIELVPLN